MNADKKQTKYKVMLKFGDNDFNHTFRHVFSLLREKFLYEESDLFLDKEFICKFINELALPIYKTMQCRKNSGHLLKEERFSTMVEQDEFYRKYLLVTPKNILLNKEVDEEIKKSGWMSNCEWTVFDSSIFPEEHQVYII